MHFVIAWESIWQFMLFCGLCAVLYGVCLIIDRTK